MDLVERKVEGLLCGALLAPLGWTARVHHDVLEDSSLNVAHFERLDISRDFFYVAEYFVPLGAVSEEFFLEQQLQQRLFAFFAHDAKPVRRPACVVCKLEKPDGNTSHTSLAALLDQYTLLTCVALWVADMEFGDMEKIIRNISNDLRERYMHRLDGSVPDASAHNCGVGVVYTMRGRSVVHITRQAMGAVKWNPTLCERVDGMLRNLKEELGLVSENLSLAVRGVNTVVLVVLLPMSPGISLMKHRAIERVWAQHVKRSGWHSELLQRVNPSILELAVFSSFCGVTPRSTFYFLSKEKGDVEGVVAWVAEPRVGSDSCVVLLATASNERLDFNNTNQNTHPCQTQCEWLQRTFRLCIANAASWTPLGVGKEPGFLFRDGSLVVRIPSMSMTYKNVTAVATAAISAVSLGSITVTAEDVSLTFRRQVTFTLLNELRCSEDYIDYVITEYLYDVPLEKRTAIFRKGRRKQKIPPAIKRNFGKGEEHSVWIRLKEDGAVYCVARECGVGRLLLTQACVFGHALDDAAAERWEKWISGIDVMAVVQ
ncbi:Present in the outer mitochondrial membrane proteome 38 [Trypanosoma cruzi]|uniref:Present in the outer mitochondrial membrane proteome 38 n=1 Tax=Trypanosoma cruzi TaxID=5693 RepID=A0A2V2V491_TRYCR|nr:Present in the outer mitochondrial membrane proteome 38 [Trypanosoma cruzi]